MLTVEGEGETGAGAVEAGMDTRGAGALLEEPPLAGEALITIGTEGKRGVEGGEKLSVVFGASLFYMLNIN